MNADPQELARLIAEFGKAYTRRIWTEMDRAGTTPARARLLMALQCQGACTMGAVGGRLGVTPRNVTQLVDGLEAEGLVTREPHPADRRATVLRLTPQGMHVCKESMLANHEAAAVLFERLTAAERRDLARVLTKLIEALGAMETADPA
jgi:DNA-binding MarR family transcriptional regulator